MLDSRTQVEDAKKNPLTELTRVRTGSSETEGIIAAAICAIHDKGGTDIHTTSFTWEDITKELEKIGLNYLATYTWFRVMVYGRNSNKDIDDGVGPTNRYKRSIDPDDTGKMLVANVIPQDITQETFKKIELVLGKKVQIQGTIVILKEE